MAKNQIDMLNLHSLILFYYAHITSIYRKFQML